MDVLRHKDRGHRTKEDGIAVEEGDKLLGGCQDFPLEHKVSHLVNTKSVFCRTRRCNTKETGAVTHRNKGPATNYGGENLTTSDVDIPGSKSHQIVGGTN